MDRSKILEEAGRCVCGDRDHVYGSPAASFEVIAKYWSIYLSERCTEPMSRVVVAPQDVAAMMALFKIARITTGRAKADNWIDLAGYAACGGEVEGCTMEASIYGE